MRSSVAQLKGSSVYGAVAEEQLDGLLRLWQ